MKSSPDGVTTDSQIDDFIREHAESAFIPAALRADGRAGSAGGWSIPNCG